MSTKINFGKIIKKKEKKEKEKKKIKEKIQKTEKIKEKKPKKKRRFRFFYWLLVLIVFMCLCGFVAGVGFCYYIVTSAPEFDTDKMFEKEATRIFDASGTLFATLGTEQRQKVTYDELPEVPDQNIYLPDGSILNEGNIEKSLDFQVHQVFKAYESDQYKGLSYDGELIELKKTPPESAHFIPHSNYMYDIVGNDEEKKIILYTIFDSI